MADDKVYIWGFPGIGKSDAASKNRNIYDADCERFKYVFPNSASDRLLHCSGDWSGVKRNPHYPSNYFDHIAATDANVVLLNCHISLLDRIDKEHLMLVYPSENLKHEYIERYIRRGDNPSFIEYMEENFNDIVSACRRSPYRTYEVVSSCTYLQDLLNGGSLMSQFMTKPELTEYFRECLDFGIIKLDESAVGKTPAELAQMLFEGKIKVDLDQTKAALDLKKQSIREENFKRERRGGLSHEELSDKIMQGIVNGALGIRYAQIAPYSYGYEVTFGGRGQPGSTQSFTNRWECYGGNFFDVPDTVADFISKGRQHNEVFGEKCDPLDIQKMLQAIDEMESRKITSFTPEQETDFVRVVNRNHFPYHSSVATVMDVHAGKGLDGIVQHHYHGDYSTITPAKQNSLVETLVCLKGFCLDCINSLDIDSDERKCVVNYLISHGTDISTPEKLEEWIALNPSKCARAENRKRRPSLETQIQSASTRAVESFPAPDVKGKEPEPEH